MGLFYSPALRAPPQEGDAYRTHDLLHIGVPLLRGQGGLLITLLQSLEDLGGEFVGQLGVVFDEFLD